MDKVPIQNENGSVVANRNVFAQSAYWKVLEPKTAEVKDPTINTENRAPTVGEEEVIHMKKRNYPHVFDRAPFDDTIEVDLLDCFERITKT